MSGPECLFYTWTDQQKTKYKNAMLQLASKGAHQAAMATALGLNSEDTFYRWKREIPEFKEWCDEAKLYSKVYWEEQARQAAVGENTKANSTMLMVILNNKFGDEYKRGTSDSQSIQANTVNILNISSEELDYKIAQKQELLKKYGMELISSDADKQG